MILTAKSIIKIWIFADSDHLDSSVSRRFTLEAERQGSLSSYPYPLRRYVHTVRETLLHRFPDSGRAVPGKKAENHPSLPGPEYALVPILRCEPPHPLFLLLQAAYTGPPPYSDTDLSRSAKPCFPHSARSGFLLHAPWLSFEIPTYSHHGL